MLGVQDFGQWVRDIISTGKTLQSKHLTPSELSLMFMLRFAKRFGDIGSWGPAPLAPKDFFKIMQFAGNFKEKNLF